MLSETKPTAIQKKVFHSTIAKLQKSQELKERLLPYLQANHPHLLNNSVRLLKIKECCNVVAFRRYLETGDVQLVSSNFCKYDRICIACATKRAMRMIKKFSQGIEEHGLYDKKRYYIVLTISHKQWDSLAGLMDRLMLYKNKLARAYRNSKRTGQKTKSFFSHFDGMVLSIEISHKGKNGRHPHINILACSDVSISIEEGKYARWATNQQLLDERKSITNDTSYIHNIRYIEVKKDHFARSGIGEVFKYAIKFSDLNVEQLAEVMSVQNQNQYRFFATYGIFRWRKLKNIKWHRGDWTTGTFLRNEDETKYTLSSHIYKV